GPQKEAVMTEVIGRLAGAFRGSEHDIKKLFREILNSQAYQRQTRTHDFTFAANQPTRMQNDALWQALVGTLGPLANNFGPRFGMGMGPFARFQGFEGLFKREFGFDPSTRPEEVEGSVPQALLLMNNPQINQKIKAKGDNFLAKI